MVSNIEIELKNIILSVLTKKITNDCITIDSNLINDFDMDSVQIIELIVQIEEKFNIEFDDDDLDIDILSIYQNLRNLILKKIENGVGHEYRYLR